MIGARMQDESASAVPDLECRNLTRRFGTFLAVNDVSFSIPAGKFFSILGPSGCGKTTLLRMMAGFLEPTEGDIFIKGRSVVDVPPNKRSVNLIFQHLALFPMMNVADNIAYGLRRRKESKAEIERKVKAVLERIDLPDVGQKRIQQLSGGQKQRIAIARCLVLDPAVLLLDEPLGALDLKLREHMKVELKKLQSEFGTTFVYITHDQSEALVMSDEIAVMHNGVFEQVGTAQDLYYHPRSSFVAGFVGDSNKWHGRVDAVDRDGVRLTTQDGISFVARNTKAGSFAQNDAVEIFVRPESIALSRDQKSLPDIDNHLKGTVDSFLFNGANSKILVREEKTGGEITVAVPQTGEHNGLVRGDTVHLAWKHEQATCFSTSPQSGEKT